MAHDHAHGSIANTGAEHQKRLMMSLGLTSTVFIAEVISAVITESLALLVDAGHMLTDMSVLIASTVTAILMQRKPSNKRTWGWARLEVLTAAVGALILLIVGIYALVEAGMRLFGGSADEVNDVRLLLFMGILGLAANIGSIFILASQSEDNMNMKAAFLEVMNDALGSVAVIVSASVLICTGWAGFDVCGRWHHRTHDDPASHQTVAQRGSRASRRNPPTVLISMKCVPTWNKCRMLWRYTTSTRASYPQACRSSWRMLWSNKDSP